jgi:methylenetetrahydrofolate dehydrogenase (NADP+)/methenyltetrahydrofolate cyclohydrolase
MTGASATTIDGKSIAAKMRAEVAVEAAALAGDGWQPCLMSITVGVVAAA